MCCSYRSLKIQGKVGIRVYSCQKTIVAKNFVLIQLNSNLYLIKHNLSQPFCQTQYIYNFTICEIFTILLYHNCTSHQSLSLHIILVTPELDFYFHLTIDYYLELIGAFCHSLLQTLLNIVPSSSLSANQINHPASKVKVITTLKICVG